MITKFKLFENGETLSIDGVFCDYKQHDARAFVWDSCSNNFYVAENNKQYHSHLVIKNFESFEYEKIEFIML